ncbi:MAG: DUF3048 domain-containing protein [Oscillospiraceae bacterium]
MKKTIATLLAVLLCFGLTACTQPNPASGDNDEEYKILGETSAPPVESKSSETVGIKNPLTGLYDLSSSAKDNRPTALMINNVDVAQSVQTGLDQADIVYETYVEGGITRLLAVFKDIKKVDKLGTIRSARVPFAELAAGHDGMYVHAGIDPTYCEPFLKKRSADNVNLNSGSANTFTMREKNGKAYEHTLYTTGEKLTSCFESLKRRTKVKDSFAGDWQSFNSPDSPRALSSGAASSVKVPMSAQYVSGFSYNAESKKYEKSQNGNPHKDCQTGKAISFDNVFVLFSTIQLMPDQKHVKTLLSSGEGFYISKGAYEKISWKKGDTDTPLKLLKSDGAALDVNAGNSWICFADKNIKTSVSVS